MQKSYAVIGLGRFGSAVARELFKLGNEVLAIDTDEEKVRQISHYVTHSIQMDATEEDALIDAGVRNIDAAIIAVSGDLRASIMATIVLKEMGVPYVAVKAHDELQGKVLAKVGADRVLFPEYEMGVRFAHSLVASNIIEHIELSPKYSLVEINALPEWYNKDLKNLDLRKRYGISIMSIKHSNGELSIAPTGDTYLKTGDTLIVIGLNDDIKRLEAIAQKRRR